MPSHNAFPPHRSPSRSLPPPPSKTSLPSIRQLDPYLQLPHTMSQHMLPGADPSASAFSYQPPSQYAPQQQPPAQGARRDSETYGGPDTDPEDTDLQGPPKKKRRRQALSCTECKRRKIKCDRNQPCAPCTRRGEQAKCQWHIVEPVEKYVTRAEYDELKTRFDQLEAFVQQRLGPPMGPQQPPVNIPYYQTGIPSGMPGTVSSEAVHAGGPSSFSSYHPGTPPPQATSGPLLYQPMMPPPSSFQHQSTFDPSSRPYPKQESQSPRHPQSPSLSRRPPDPGSGTTKSPSMTTPLPHSLASITSPYNTDHQPKNLHAQMLRLGERLRPIINGCRPAVVRP